MKGHGVKGRECDREAGRKKVVGSKDLKEMFLFHVMPLK
jgi:hypothetical protein